MVETTIVLVLIFGVLVTFHELGHFVVAKLGGIRVEEFAFGFGPRLITLFKRRGTDYTLHLLPIGGFVKLTGMEPGQEDIPDGFQAQAIWKRALVVLAGPGMSFVLAVAALVFVGVYWGFPNLSLPENRVGQVKPKTEAARIDLRAGDRILEIDGIKIGQGRDMTHYIHDRPGRQITLLVERRGSKLMKVGTPQWTISYLGATWSFMRQNRAVVEGVAQRCAAKKAGIQPDDVLVSIDGRGIFGGLAMVDAIKSNGTREVTLELMRGGKRVAVKARPDVRWVSLAGVKWEFPGGVAGSLNGDIRQDSTAGKAGVRPSDWIVSVGGSKVETGEQLLNALRTGWQQDRLPAIRVTREELGAPIEVKPTAEDYATVRTGYYDAVGLLGFLPAPTLEKVGFAESLDRGVKEFLQRAVYLLGILTSKRIAKDVGGPVMIAKATAWSVALGPYYVVDMVGMLSLSLAFINLIPIPILDGGHVVILIIEAIRRKRLSPQQAQAVTLAGLTTIILLAVLILYLDIFRIMQGLVPQ